jgi:hypothetical protein
MHKNVELLTKLVDKDMRQLENKYKQDHQMIYFNS